MLHISIYVFYFSNARKDKILGYPIHIENPKYPRNQLIFNLCFVCDASKKTMQYEPLVRKLANYLVKLEVCIRCF